MKTYLITDPSFYSSTPDVLEASLKKVFSQTLPDFVLFRDKQTPSYSELASIFIEVCQKKDIGKVLLHGDPLIAYRLKADGVHLTSMQFNLIREAKELGLYVIVSTHTHLEALMAQQMGADAITYSPIFISPDKGEPKGLEDLKEIVDKIEVPIFALGGIITQEQINAVETTGAYGFASIRYFIR